MEPGKLPIDRASFQLGMINCFAEMVAVGMKTMAISPPLSPLEYEAIRESSHSIVAGFGIHSYLEQSLLVTHLQSAEFTRGMWSILYYKDPQVLEAYLALKESRSSLEDAGALTPEALKEISRALMGMLSYPEEIIEEKIRGGGETDPFILG